MTGSRAAAFLDRDGTIIEDVSYIADPAAVRLLPGAGEAIARLNAAGVLAIIISNQSGIGRGYYGSAEFQQVQRRVEELLAHSGGRIDATYICPHSPLQDEVCQCRKPGTLLYRTAITDHDIDPCRSWYFGDRWRDLAAAEVLGGHGVLIPAADTPQPEIRLAEERFSTAPSLAAAVERALASY